MAEIERKFMIVEVPRAESTAAEIEQGYLALDAQGEVRLRRIDGELLLTAKTGRGEIREEVEVPIEPSAFAALWPLTAGRRVRKVRHYVPLGEGLRAEVDIYAEALDGLRTAEVEFASPAQADRFTPPPWFGAEVTGDERYANRTLATRGLPNGAGKRDDAGMEATPGVEAAPGHARAGRGRAYRLLGDEDAAAGVRRVIVGRLDQAAERLRGADEGDGKARASAIHGARKDVKKARAALRLIREALGEETFKRENRDLRDAARSLAPSRDAVVKLATLDALVEGAGDPSPAATAPWRRALVADRDRIAGGKDDGTPATAIEAGGHDETAAAVAAIEAVSARAPGWRMRTDGWELLATGLDTAYREGRHAFAALGEAPGFDAVHELRKRGKDLWYQVRLLRDAWEPVLGATAAELDDFTDRLGEHHDLAVLAVDLAGRAEVDPAGRETMRELIEARQASLLAAAVASGERLYAEKPKAFRRRLRAYWRAWRLSA